MILVTYAWPVLNQRGRALAVLGVRRDPRNRRQGPGAGLAEEIAQRLNVADLTVGVHVHEPG